jgi:hypothetical protein
MTVIQELISEFEEIKKTKCKTLQEVIFFDGVLAIIEGKYLKKEQEQEKNKFSEEDMIAFGNKMQLVSDVDFDGNIKFAFDPSQAIKQFKNK